MAEKEAAAPAEQKPKPKFSQKTLIIMGAVMLLEGGGISLIFMLSKSPAPAHGSDTPIVETQQDSKTLAAEVVLMERSSVDNYNAGRGRTMITLEVSAKVGQDKKDKLAETLKNHSTEIRDAIRTLVSQAVLDNLRDPKLQVIKREIKASMELILGENAIDEILVPSWHCYSTD